MTLRQIQKLQTAERRLREARDRYMDLADSVDEVWVRRISRSLSIELGTAVGERQRWEAASK